MPAYTHAHTVYPQPSSWYNRAHPCPPVNSPYHLSERRGASCLGPCQHSSAPIHSGHGVSVWDVAREHAGSAGVETRTWSEQGARPVAEGGAAFLLLALGWFMFVVARRISRFCRRSSAPSPSPSSSPLARTVSLLHRMASSQPASYTEYVTVRLLRSVKTVAAARSWNGNGRLGCAGGARSRHAGGRAGSCRCDHCSRVSHQGLSPPGRTCEVDHSVGLTRVSVRWWCAVIAGGFGDGDG